MTDRSSILVTTLHRKYHEAHFNVAAIMTNGSIAALAAPFAEGGEAGFELGSIGPHIRLKMKPSSEKSCEPLRQRLADPGLPGAV